MSLANEEKVDLFRHKLATALQMNEEEQLRPKVTVQARGLLAERLFELAEEHDIPVVQDADLAEDLKFLEVGSSLPTGLFSPIAEILAHLYLISQKSREKGISIQEKE